MRAPSLCQSCFQKKCINVALPALSIYVKIVCSLFVLVVFIPDTDSGYKVMHLPETYQVAYIDFDSFFASVEEQEAPKLQGKAVGVVPIEYDKPTSLIAVNKVAKQKGVRG